MIHTCLSGCPQGRPSIPHAYSTAWQHRHCWLMSQLRGLQFIVCSRCQPALPNTGSGRYLYHTPARVGALGVSGVMGHEGWMSFYEPSYNFSTWAGSKATASCEDVPLQGDWEAAGTGLGSSVISQLMIQSSETP